MPKGGDKLPDSQLDIIRQWIASNAPEKAGGVVAKGERRARRSRRRRRGEAARARRRCPRTACSSLSSTHCAAAPSRASRAAHGRRSSPSPGKSRCSFIIPIRFNLLGVLPFPEGFPAIVRFSHNGSLLIAGGGIGAKLGHVVIWDVVTGRRITEVGDEFDTVLAADISPDQSLVALGGPSRLVKIFSASDGKMICKMKKHTDWVTALCFTPDGK